MNKTSVLLQSPRRSRGRPIGSQGVKGLAYRVTGGQRVGLKGLKNEQKGAEMSKNEQKYAKKSRN